MISQNIYPRIYIALDVAHNFLVVNQQQKCSVKLLIHGGLMKKLAALLASVAVLWGSHAAAVETFKGEEAIELILEAHDEGLIITKGTSSGSVTYKILLDRRYYRCSINNYLQVCHDFTGIDGKYEE